MRVNRVSLHWRVQLIQVVTLFSFGDWVLNQLKHSLVPIGSGTLDLQKARDTGKTVLIAEPGALGFAPKQTRTPGVPRQAKGNTEPPEEYVREAPQDRLVWNQSEGTCQSLIG